MKFSSSLIVLVTLSVLYIGVRTQDTDSGTEVENSTPGTVVDYEPEYKPRRPVDKFDKWMKVLNEFFTEGNWLNGGPSNLMDFITKTLSKLLDILLPKQIGDDGANTNSADRPDRFSFRTLFRRPSANPSSTTSSASTPRDTSTSGMTINDLIRMLPQDSLNVPVDRVLGGSRRF